MYETTTTNNYKEPRYAVIGVLIQADFNHYSLSSIASVATMLCNYKICSMLNTVSIVIDNFTVWRNERIACLRIY